jgi:hypothetical protein
VTRSLRFFAVLMPILLIAHHAPAPIVEEPETPTPARTAETAKPKEPPSPASNIAKRKPTPKPQSQPSLRQRRFAGTWTGVMREENGQTYPVRVTIDPTETKATANGPVFSNEPGTTTISGNTLSWKWMLDSWSMTLSSETSAQLVKHYLSTVHTGTIKKIQ